MKCTKNEIFWQMFFNWYNKICLGKYLYDFRLIVFGFKEKETFCLNYCLLQAKMYIHETYQKHSGTNNHYFSFTLYLEKLKSVLVIEKTIALRNRSVERFNNRFGLLYNSF